jgi:hypothetical protein
MSAIADLASAAREQVEALARTGSLPRRPDWTPSW